MTSHPDNPSAPALRLEDVSFAYDSEEVLRGISCDIAPGEFVGIVGPNGAGKTTLIRMISGMLTPDSGHARVDGHDIAHMHPRERALRIALVPQDERVVFPWSVTSMVLLGRHPHRGGLGFEKAEDFEAAEDAMTLMRISHLASRSVLDLSGGELHRVLIARALAQQTPVLLLDEPNAHLDIRHQVELFDLLARLHGEEGRTVVIITHDLNLAATHCDRILLIDEGRLAASGSPGDVLREELISRHFGVGVEVRTDQESGRPVLRVLRKNRVPVSS